MPHTSSCHGLGFGGVSGFLNSVGICTLDLTFVKGVITLNLAVSIFLIFLFVLEIKFLNFVFLFGKSSLLCRYMLGAESWKTDLAYCPVGKSILWGYGQGQACLAFKILTSHPREHCVSWEMAGDRSSAWVPATPGWSPWLLLQSLAHTVAVNLGMGAGSL